MSARASIRRLAWAAGTVIAAALTLSPLASPAASAAGSANLLANPGFTAAGPSGAYTSFTSTGAGSNFGPSAAGHWNWYARNFHSASTDLLPPTSGRTGKMIHVTTDGSAGGIYQVFAPAGGGPATASFSVWVYVVEGAVAVGLGNGGSTGPAKLDTQPGQWVNVTGSNTSSPANEFIVYGWREGGVTTSTYSDFYVANASVVAG
jgi:hypothetical protein